MILKKGLPRVGELVICTVKRINPHSAFVSLDEYDNLEAMLHISEVASGRIKNIRDHLTLDKQIVCVVMRVDKRGYIDVSLKRVRDNERRKKFTEWRLSKRLDSLLGFLSKKLKKSHEPVEKAILERYGSLGAFLALIQRKGVHIIDSLNIESEWKDALKKEIEAALSRKKYEIKAVLRMYSYEPDGVERIRKVLSELSGVELSYLGAPKYLLRVISNNYKSAESTLSNALEKLSKRCKQENVFLEVKR